MYSRYSFFYVLLLLVAILKVQAQNDLFYGPFKSWTNLKEAYGAKGNGISDDTKAIQFALDNLGKNGKPPVLYIPAGTYCITATLKMATRKNVAIIGEDPEKTIIKWNGADSMKMFALNGVSYSEYGRITWDGNHKAFIAIAHEWDGRVQFANTGTQHVDEVFKNVGVGLKSGSNMDAEFAIRRCRFYNCTSTGISLQGWNALDWWIWDCYFEDCYVGASNCLPGSGAGNFHVYRSIFNHSLKADIQLGNSEFFSFRDNISYDSKCFILASQWSNTSPITLQANTIIRKQNTAVINLFTKGNVLLIDNLFIVPDSSKVCVVDISDSYRTPPSEFTAIGNQFSAKQNMYSMYGRVIDIDTKTGIQPTKVVPVIKPIAFAKKSVYPIYEVNTKMSNDEIQDIITKTANQKSKIVIHFASGVYNIAKTLKIPAGAEIILIGDGMSTQLNWSAPNTGSIIEMLPPAKCILQNIYLNGANKADGILIDDNDKDGNLIYGDQVLLYHGVASNLFINGFGKTDFRIENFQHNYCDTGTSIKMVGLGEKNSSMLKIFGGESANLGNSYSISNGGRILIYDTWYENGVGARFMTLRGNGEFILDGGKIANTTNLPGRFIDIDSFRGKVTLAEIIFVGPKKTLYFNNRYKDASLLVLGNLNWSDSTNKVFDMHSSAGNYGMVNNRENVGRGSYPLPNMGDSTENFIKKMFATVRQTRVSDKPKKINNDNSNIVLRRVMIENGINNLKIEHVKE